MSLVSEQGEFTSFNSFGDYIILPKLVSPDGVSPPLSLGDSGTYCWRLLSDCPGSCSSRQPQSTTPTRSPASPGGFLQETNPAFVTLTMHRSQCNRPFVLFWFELCDMKLVEVSHCAIRTINGGHVGNRTQVLCLRNRCSTTELAAHKWRSWPPSSSDAVDLALPCDCCQWIYCIMLSGSCEPRNSLSSGLEHRLVDTGRIELPSSQCHWDVLPLNYRPVNWWTRLESNQQCLSFNQEYYRSTTRPLKLVAVLRVSTPLSPQRAMHQLIMSGNPFYARARINYLSIKPFGKWKRGVDLNHHCQGRTVG